MDKLDGAIVLLRNLCPLSADLRDLVVVVLADFGGPDEGIDDHYIDLVCSNGRVDLFHNRRDDSDAVLSFARDDHFGLAAGVDKESIADVHWRDAVMQKDRREPPIGFDARVFEVDVPDAQWTA